MKDLQDLLKGGPGHPIDMPWGQRPLEWGGDMPTLGHRGVQALGGKEGRSGSRELCSHVAQHVSLAHYAARERGERKWQRKIHKNMFFLEMARKCLIHFSPP